jgi:hypothetical protein
MDQEFNTDFDDAVLDGGPNEIEILGQNLLASEFDNLANKPSDGISNIAGNLNNGDNIPDNSSSENTELVGNHSESVKIIAIPENVIEVAVQEQNQLFSVYEFELDKSTENRSVSIIEMEETVEETRLLENDDENIAVATIVKKKDVWIL